MVDGSSMRLKIIVIGASRIFTQLLTYRGFAHKFSVDQVLFMPGGLLSEQKSRLNCSLARPQRHMDNGGIYSIRRVSDVCGGVDHYGYKTLRASERANRTNFFSAYLESCKALQILSNPDSEKQWGLLEKQTFETASRDAISAGSAATMVQGNKIEWDDGGAVVFNRDGVPWG
jgi:hypothetical protein